MLLVPVALLGHVAFRCPHSPPSTDPCPHSLSSLEVTCFAANYTSAVHITAVCNPLATRAYPHTWSAAAGAGSLPAAGPRAGQPPECEPGQAKPSQDKPSQAKSSQAEPSQAKQSHARPGQAKPGQTKPSQAKPR
jgi:hypothetical protein